MEKLSEHKKTVGDKEITYTLYGELVCPNPTEYYRMTRPYADMRAEYELLTCNTITDEDMLLLDSKLKALEYSRNRLRFSVISLVLVVILGMVLL
jgi:hypothetical protein